MWVGDNTPFPSARFGLRVIFTFHGPRRPRNDTANEGLRVIYFSNFTWGRVLMTDFLLTATSLRRETLRRNRRSTTTVISWFGDSTGYGQASTLKHE